MECGIFTSQPEQICVILFSWCFISLFMKVPLEKILTKNADKKMEGGERLNKLSHGMEDAERN